MRQLSALVDAAHNRQGVPTALLCAGGAPSTLGSAAMKDFDKDGDGELSREEFANLIQNIDRTRRGLPPTAQVAKQQGLYLAASLNAEAHGKPKVRAPPAFPSRHHTMTPRSSMSCRV